MARQRYDIGSKWLLQNQPKGALSIGGLDNVRRTESVPARIVEAVGEKKAMFESPVVQRWKAEAIHNVIVAVLKNRFKTVPQDVTKQLHKILNEKKLTSLSVLASECADLDAFRKALLA